jgi:NTE family protein
MSTTPAELAAKYETIALCLQGGGALGAYQAGVYQALDEAGIRPTWVAGISIGSINSAIIAGNPPERRVERLRRFWETVSRDALPFEAPELRLLSQAWFNDFSPRGLAGLGAAAQVMLQGSRGFFSPRIPPPWLRAAGTAGATSFYDASPLARTLERLVDFEYLNFGGVRATFGAVEIATGNFKYFDSARPEDQPLGIGEIMASGALPPVLGPVAVRGKQYWDGGLVSNTPLEYVLDDEPRRDSLVFQVDLWSARGELPRDLLEVAERQKDIQFSSRTRKGTDRLVRRQNLRRVIQRAIDSLPPAVRVQPEVARLAAEGCRKVMNIVHLIYQTNAYETHAKDYEFSAATMEAHWRAGHEDAKGSLARPEFLARPEGERAVVTHDIHRQGTPKSAAQGLGIRQNEGTK